MFKRGTIVLMCLMLTLSFSFLSVVQPVMARTTYLSDGLYETLQEAVNQATPGDTIQIPAGDYTLTRPVVINKSLIIRGTGIESTTINVGATVSFFVNADHVKIEGIKFIGRDGTTGDRAVDIGNVQDFAIVNTEFNNISRAGVVVTGEDARGVISNSRFIDIYAGSGVVVYGGGNPNWDRPLDLGSEDAVFVEDCYFLRNMHGIASNDGSKYVFRYNEVEDSLSTHQAVDAHGLEYGSTRGSRSFEVYGNTILNSYAHYAGIWMRGGDGLIYDNTMNDCTYGILLSNLTQALPEGTEYPYPDQTSVLYAWNNTVDGEPVGISVRDGHEVFLQEDRDFFNVDYTTTESSYAPYIYPHPLTLESAWVPPEPEIWDSNSGYTSGVYPLGDANTGSLLVKFDFAHGSIDSESVIGYANSDTTVEDADSLFLKIRAVGGSFTAWDGDSYTALNGVTYGADSQSFVKIWIDFDYNTYDVWVTPEGGSEIKLGEAFAIDPSAQDLGKICLKSDTNNDFSVIEHTVISYAPPALIESDQYSVNSFTEEVNEEQVQREEGLCTFTPVGGLVLAEFDFVPYSENINGVAGFAGPDTFIEGYANFSFMFRAYTDGYFDSYDTNAYKKANLIPYNANTKYHVEMLIDFGVRTYNAWVTPEGGEKVLLSDNYGFRAATVPQIDELGKVFLRSNNDGDFGIINLTVTYQGPGSEPGEPEPTPTIPPESDLITNLVVNDTNNAGNWSIQTNLQEGDLQYGDRAFTYGSIPSQLLGADWIRTANSSKGYTENPVTASFEVMKNAYVYVAYSDQIPNKWIISGWKDTGDEIVNSEPKPYRVYRKFYPAGSVVELGYNGTSNYGNYSVIVKERVLIDELDTKYTSIESSAWSVKTNLQEGDLQYGDRVFTLTSVPALVAGCDWISPANGAKGQTMDPVASFKVKADAYVYVAYHDQIDPGIRWITSEWEDTGEDIVNSESTPQVFSLYRKYFPADSTVNLGPNGTSAKGHYIVIVDEFDRIETAAIEDVTVPVGETVTIGLSPNVTGSAVEVDYNAQAIEISTEGYDLNITGIEAGSSEVIVTLSHEEYINGGISFNVCVTAEIDKSVLEEVIAAAQMMDAVYYTEASWEAFDLVLQNALETKNNEDASQEEIDAAVSALTSAIDALERIAIIISDETDGGAGKVRTITLSEDLVCEYLIVRFTEGPGANPKVSVVMISPVGNTVTISYQKSGTKIDVWAADGMPDLTGGDMGVEITATASAGYPSENGPGQGQGHGHGHGQGQGQGNQNQNRRGQ